MLSVFFKGARSDCFRFFFFKLSEILVSEVSLCFSHYPWWILTAEKCTVWKIPIVINASVILIIIAVVDLLLSFLSLASLVNNETVMVTIIYTYTVRYRQLQIRISLLVLKRLDRFNWNETKISRVIMHRLNECLHSEKSDHAPTTK